MERANILIDKVHSRKELEQIARDLKRAKKIIGFTSGVFDLLHPGHVQYLAKAKAACDVLIVGINSDSSVKSIKGELRPICSEKERAEVLSALSAVDYVFIFSEPNNNSNVELLKPDIYVKAGDYDKSKLSSAALVEAYGGKVLIVPFEAGYSSSAIIDKVITAYSDRTIAPTGFPKYEKAPAVFLDRDGTLNEHVEYLHEVSKFKLVPGVLDAMRRIKAKGFRLVVVTNQPGIGIGYFTREQFFEVNREFLRACDKAGIGIDRVYYCPHNKADNCDCRKPKTGMLTRAAKDLNLDISKSFMVGDMSSDIKAGKDMGCRTVLVKTGLAGKDKLFDLKPDFEAASLVQAAEWIIKQN